MMDEYQNRFFSCYCAYQNLNPNKAVQAYVDSELSARYPVILKKAPGRLIVGVSEAIADACDPIEHEFSVEASYGDVMAFLFDEEIGFTPDESYISALNPKDFSPIALPSDVNVRVLTRKDAKLLRTLEKTLTAPERLTAQVSISDLSVMGLFQGESLLSAASLLKWNEIYDIGVMTHGQARHRGYGSMVTSELCRLAISQGFLLQYRADQTNIASVALMKKLGFSTQLTLHGGIIHIKER